MAQAKTQAWPDGYVLVKTPVAPSNVGTTLEKSCVQIDQPVDVKDDGKAPGFAKALIKLAGIPRGAGRFKTMKPLPVRLCWRRSQVSAANTALTAVTTLAPSSASEWSNVSGLFDEVKVVAMQVYFQVGVIGSTLNTTMGVLAYDPANNAVYGSAAGACSATQHVLFGLPTGNVLPQSMSRLGLWKFAIKVPPGVQTSGQTGGATTTGYWTDTKDTGDAYGFLKPYLEAPGGGGTTQLDMMIVFDCEFRSRS